MIIASLHLYDYLTTSEAFAIEEVELKGMVRVDPSDVERLLGDLRGQNILLAPLDSYRDRIRAHPRVEHVSFKRVLPSKVVCSVDEREPVALLFTDRFVELDASGMVMGEDEYSALLDLPIITGVPGTDIKIGRVCKIDGVQDALEALRLCKTFGEGFAEEISELRISRGGLLIRPLKDDCVLVLGEEDFANRLKKYFLLRDTIDERDQTEGLIDLRFEDQVVLRGQM